jgi:putative glutamine amidotransferase
MKKPLIGITAGEAKNRYFPSAPKMYGQQYTYIEAVERAGGIPVIISIVKAESVLRQLYDLCDGLLLAGGNDINPSTYKAQASPQTKHLHKERDEQELKLAAWAEAEDKPILAICRGMQILNIAQGGSLYQDIPSEVPNAVTHEIPYKEDPDREHHLVHTLRIDPNSRLASILGVTSIQTNAYHHQAIKKLGKDLIATAWTPDEIIEALEQPAKKFVIGVQSHPEALERDIETAWRRLFSEFIEAARQ